MEEAHRLNAMMGGGEWQGCAPLPISSVLSPYDSSMKGPLPMWMMRLRTTALNQAAKTSQQIEQWRQLSPAQRLASQHYWRAKKWNGNQPNGYWTARQWERLCARTRGCCAYCGTPTKQLSPDHIQPLAHGGTNDFSNIAPVCMPCQFKKGAKPVWEWFTPDEFDALIAWLHPVAA